MRQAMIALMPRLEVTSCSPTVMSKNVPVPWVHLTVPGSRQRWANSAACWSATAEAIGTSAPNTDGSVTPNDPESSRTSGSIDRGMPRWVSQSSYQSSACRS